MQRGGDRLLVCSERSMCGAAIARSRRVVRRGAHAADAGTTGCRRARRRSRHAHPRRAPPRRARGRPVPPRCTPRSRLRDAAATVRACRPTGESCSRRRAKPASIAVPARIGSSSARRPASCSSSSVRRSSPRASGFPPVAVTSRSATFGATVGFSRAMSSRQLARSSPSSTSSGKPDPSNPVASCVRAVAISATPSRPSRCAAKASASIDAASAHWRSSMATSNEPPPAKRSEHAQRGRSDGEAVTRRRAAQRECPGQRLGARLGDLGERCLVVAEELLQHRERDRRLALDAARREHGRAARRGRGRRRSAGARTFRSRARRGSRARCSCRVRRPRPRRRCTPSRVLVRARADLLGMRLRRDAGHAVAAPVAGFDLVVPLESAALRAIGVRRRPDPLEQSSVPIRARRSVDPVGGRAPDVLPAQVDRTAARYARSGQARRQAPEVARCRATTRLRSNGSPTSCGRTTRRSRSPFAGVIDERVLASRALAER